MNPTPPRPTNDTTELAKERSRQASERTITGWIGSSLLLMGFGISIEEIQAVMSKDFPPNSSEISLQFTNMVSLSAIAFGIVLLVLASITHGWEIHSLEQDNYLTTPPRLFNLMLVVGSVILFGLFVLVNVILVISQQ